MNLITRPEVVMARGQGSWLEDESGRRYLDLIQGWAVNCLGHAPPELSAALAAQSGRLLNVSPAYFTRPLLDLVQRLCAVTSMSRVFLTSSGAEANDAAIKLARKWAKLHRPRSHRIVTMRDSFHGRTLACVAASGKPGWENAFPPMLEGFDKVPFGDVAAVAAAIDERTCAVMLEPIQGEAGVIVPPAGYLRALRELTRERGILLILDEIQTGCARTGPFLRAHSEDVTPDILTLGKGLGGGVPIGALLATEAAAAFEPGDHGGTYTGNPLTASCALAVLQEIARPEFAAQVSERGLALRGVLERVAAASPIRVNQIRGAGLLWAMDLDAPCASSVRERAMEVGLLINSPRPHTLRFMPQLRVLPGELQELEEKLLLALRLAQKS